MFPSLALNSSAPTRTRCSDRHATSTDPSSRPRPAHRSDPPTPARSSPTPDRARTRHTRGCRRSAPDRRHPSRTPRTGRRPRSAAPSTRRCPRPRTPPTPARWCSTPCRARTHPDALFPSPATRFDAADENATYRPSSDTDTSNESPFANAPLAPDARDTNVVVPATRSRTNTSALPFASPGTRFDAADTNATYRGVTIAHRVPTDAAGHHRCPRTPPTTDRHPLGRARDPIEQEHVLLAVRVPTTRFDAADAVQHVPRPDLRRHRRAGTNSHSGSPPPIGRTTVDVRRDRDTESGPAGTRPSATDPRRVRIEVLQRRRVRHDLTVRAHLRLSERQNPPRHRTRQRSRGVADTGDEPTTADQSAHQHRHHDPSHDAMGEDASGTLPRVSLHFLLVLRRRRVPRPRCPPHGSGRTVQHPTTHRPYAGHQPLGPRSCAATGHVRRGRGSKTARAPPGQSTGGPSWRYSSRMPRQRLRASSRPSSALTPHTTRSRITNPGGMLSARMTSA